MLSTFAPHTFLKYTLHSKALSVLFVAFIAVSALFLSSSEAQAACQSGYQCIGGCTTIGQCENNFLCQASRVGSVDIIQPSSISCGPCPSGYQCTDGCIAVGQCRGGKLCKELIVAGGVKFISESNETCSVKPATCSVATPCVGGCTGVDDCSGGKTCSVIFDYVRKSLVISPSGPACDQPASCATTPCEDGCTGAGACSGGRTCVVAFDSTTYSTVIKATGPTCGGGVGKATFGGIFMPGTGISQYAPGDQNTSESIGIVNFASRLLRIFTIICGLWFMFNMIYAGYLFITSSGDTAVFNKFKESLFYSLLGLLIIATAYLIAGLIGAVFFGDPGFIIRPTLFQAGTP